jgi:hypothetical protein
MAGSVPTYNNIRGYVEFGTENRLRGGSVYFTINIPISQHAATKAK